MAGDKNNSAREGYISILPAQAAAAKYGAGKDDQQMKEDQKTEEHKGVYYSPDCAKMSIVSNILGNGQQKCTRASGRWLTLLLTCPIAIKNGLGMSGTESW